MDFVVYRLTSPSNKVYIGITSQQINRRWQNGTGYRKCPAIKKAINKYGWDNIRKEVLYTGLSEKDAKLLEKELIKKHKSNDKRYGYNLTDGGDGTLGRRFTEDQKRALSEKHKGKIISEEQRQKLREANLDKHHSDETKAKMSLVHRGNKYNLGRKLTDEQKRKIGDSERGSNNPRARKVICLETLKVYDTLNDAIAETGATKISDCCRGCEKHKTSGGYHWKYYDDYLLNPV